MNYQEIARMYPKPVSGEFVRKVTPPLEIERLRLSFHTGDRSRIKTPTTGDATLLLTYKGKEGSVLSLEVDPDHQLWILQIQGARSKKSYRVNTAVVVSDLYASEIELIAGHPESGVRRLVLPNDIAGLGSAASDLAICRYGVIAYRLNMVYSNYEKAFVRDL